MDKLLFHKILNIVSGVTICILCIFLCLRSCTSPDVTQTPLVHTDTIVVVKHDTIRHTKVIKQDKWHYDTIRYHDTVYIKDEPRMYTFNNPNYSLNINSVKLYDYDLEIYRKDSIVYVDKIVEVQKKENWWKNRFVITAGVGVQYGLLHQQWDVGPQITFGIRLY